MLEQINVNNIHVVRDGKTVLKDFNFSLNIGDGVIISGDNGSGKTTLLKVIMNLLPTKSGEINLGPLKSVDLAYVPQEENHNPFPVTVWEMAEIGTSGIKLSTTARIDRIEASLKQCRCYHLKNRSYYKLSGGEKRRVSLARCLSQGAKVLLLDEPLTFLDKDSRNDFITLLNDIKVKLKKTILMVTHTENENIAEDWKHFHMEEKC